MFIIVKTAKIFKPNTEEIDLLRRLETILISTRYDIISSMEITREEILHLAKLSNFSLEEPEIESLKSDLTNIIGYISQLDELNTDDVEPTYQVFEMENIWRPDEIKRQDATPEELLAIAPETYQNQIKVPKVL